VKGAALSPEDLIWIFLEPRPALHFTDLRLKPLSFQASMDHNWVRGIVGDKPPVLKSMRGVGMRNHPRQALLRPFTLHCQGIV
jgi:hypothetical protein